MAGASVVWNLGDSLRRFGCKRRVSFI